MGTAIPATGPLIAAMIGFGTDQVGVRAVVEVLAERRIAGSLARSVNRVLCLMLPELTADRRRMSASRRNRVRRR
jgi:hypothetical protein